MDAAEKDRLNIILNRIQDLEQAASFLDYDGHITVADRMCSDNYDSFFDGDCLENYIEERLSDLKGEIKIRIDQLKD